MAPRALIDQLPLATRYAHFQLVLQIHELLNVPVLSGEFSVVYKIKHAVQLPRRRANSETAGSDIASPADDVLQNSSIDSSMNHATIETGQESTASASASTLSAASVSIPASLSTRNDTIVPNDSDDSPNTTLMPSAFPKGSARTSHTLPLAGDVHSTPMSSTLPQFGSTEELVASPDSSVLSLDHLPSAHGSAVDETTSVASPSMNRRGDARLHPASTMSSMSGFSMGPNKIIRSTTTFEGVQHHTVKWEVTAQTDVRIGINRHLTHLDRETEAGHLHSSALLLTVWWRQPDDPPDTRRRFGQIKINLAEYAPGMPPSPSERIESRQYLLDKCACNALLRLSIDMRRLDTTHSYRVPRIKQGLVDPANVIMQGRSASGERDAIYASSQREPELMHGLEWHFKLPLPMMFNIAAVRPEFLNASGRRECTSSNPNSLMHGFSRDASQPRHEFCQLNSVALVDELVQGMLGPTVDQRAESHDDEDASSSSRSPRSQKIRSRWKRIIETVAGTHHTNPHRSFSGSDAVSLRRELRPRVRSDQSKRSIPLPPLHMRFKNDDDSDPAPNTS